MASTLTTDQKRWLPGGTLTPIESPTPDRAHYRTPDGLYLYADHGQLVTPSGALYQAATPSRKILDVPYRNQRNNALNPDGACNMTSAAMTLLYYGIKPRSIYPQFEDELYDHADREGYDRHDGADISRLMRDYGINATFKPDGTLDELKGAIADGNPVILHGYFTSFGHIIVAIGYDENGLTVHDPYGEWHSWGYQRNSTADGETPGKSVAYSWDLIRNACMPDGNIWLHLTGKK